MPPKQNDPLSWTCFWLKSALDCVSFDWDPQQHAAATECLTDAEALLDEIAKQEVHIASGGKPDHEKRFTRADVMHMMAVIRALETHKAENKPDEKRRDART